MKFGLDLTIFGELADPVVLADLAVEAEDAGWDGFFLWDHVATAHDPRVTDPWIALAAAREPNEHRAPGPDGHALGAPAHDQAGPGDRRPGPPLGWAPDPGCRARRLRRAGVQRLRRRG